MNNDYYNMPADASPGLSISATKRIARSRLRGQWKKAFLPCLIITILTGIPAIFSAITSVKQMSVIMNNGSEMDPNDPMALYEVMMSVSSNGAAGAISSLLSLFTFLCAGALSVSLAALCLRIIRQEEYSTDIAFYGFRQFGQAFVVSLLIMVFTFLWAMVTILPASVVFSVGLVMENTIMAILGTIILITAIVGYILIVLRYEMSYFVASDNRMMPATHVTADSVFMMRRRTGNYFLLQLSFIGWAILASLPLVIGAELAGFSGLTESGGGALSAAGTILCVLGLIPITFFELYNSTANAVYYSTISGQYNINSPGTVPVDPSDGAVPMDHAVLPDYGAAESGAAPTEHAVQPDFGAAESGAAPMEHTVPSTVSDDSPETYAPFMSEDADAPTVSHRPEDAFTTPAAPDDDSSVSSHDPEETDTSDRFE